ncbi:MAG TPA: hypothetical protein VHY32_11365 [Caulobacteraceae bacterium]|jgi:hypothetical protein|nr:hypothetical protein [Caulobacteraceae bacterium]
MTVLKVAHVREQGIDLIICPLDDEFARRPISAQQQAAAEIQRRSSAAGLAGTVVPVWRDPSGRMGFLAPTNWHAFFRSVSLDWVWLNINRQLSW